MSVYIFRFISGSGLIRDANHECANDSDALKEAELFATDFDVEIWSGERLVARVKKDDASPA